MSPPVIPSPRQNYRPAWPKPSASAVEKCPLGSVRYELSKLRAKGLVEKLPHSRRYRLLPNGYRICLVFLKLFDKIYAPLAAGLLHPYRRRSTMSQERLTQLDKLYQSVVPLSINWSPLSD
jgi:hypothetical protein